MIILYPSFSLYRCDGCGFLFEDTDSTGAEGIAYMRNKMHKHMPDTWAKAYEQHYCERCAPAARRTHLDVIAPETAD